MSTRDGHVTAARAAGSMEIELCVWRAARHVVWRGYTHRHRLDWVRVTEWAAAALVCLRVQQPAVDALGMIAVAASWKDANHLAKDEGFHAECALGLLLEH